MKTTFKHLLALGLFAGALGVAVVQIEPAHAQARPVDCEVVYNGVTKIKGRCDFEPKEGYLPGSFTLTKTTDAGPISAEVQVTAPGVADSLFSEGDSSEGSGEVRRNGACWANDDIKICARALTPPPAKAKAKAPPKKAAPLKKAMPSKAN